MKSIGFFMKWKFPLFLGLILSVLYLHFFENCAHVELEIQVSQRTWFKIYWAGDGEEYSEKRMSRIRVMPGEQHYTALLTDLRKVKKLRVDPQQYVGRSLIKRLAITQNGLSPILFETEKDFSRLNPIYDIETSERDSNGLTTHSTGVDPRFELPLTIHQGVVFSWQLAVRIAFIFAIVVLFFSFTKSYRNEEDFIPILFVSVFSLIIVMAATSTENIHPDEYVHLDAAQYYKTNWLPPVVDDPDIRHTYSVYGVSRLNSYEISYFFTGKLAQLISSFKLSKQLNLRMFNVLLFGLLLLYILRYQRARLMAVPLLISPQLWYVFSYCNSDAFALAISFIVACQVATPDSVLNRYLSGNEKKTNVFVILLFGCFCAALFLLKKNYLFFVIFLAGYLTWRALFLMDKSTRKLFFKRLFIIVFVGLSLTGIRMGSDYAINGFDRAEKVMQIKGELAAPLYNPATPLEKKHSFLYRKSRGESLEKIIVQDRWFEKVFLSAFGMYGYFTASASDSYYTAVRWVGVGFFTFFVITIFLRGGLAGNLLLSGFLVSAATLIAFSLYHSWTKDFQPQGRYLFPIIPMSSVLVFQFYHLMQKSIVKLFLISMFLLSFYSFVFVAILQLG